MTAQAGMEEWRVHYDAGMLALRSRDDAAAGAHLGTALERLSEAGGNGITHDVQHHFRTIDAVGSLALLDVVSSVKPGITTDEGLRAAVDHTDAAVTALEKALEAANQDNRPGMQNQITWYFGKVALTHGLAETAQGLHRQATGRQRHQHLVNANTYYHMAHKDLRKSGASRSLVLANDIAATQSAIYLESTAWRGKLGWRLRVVQDLAGFAIHEWRHFGQAVDVCRDALFSAHEGPGRTALQARLTVPMTTFAPTTALPAPSDLGFRHLV